MTDANYIRRQLLLDFEHFARGMRLKDTMDFVNFIGKTKVSQDTILVSMDATSLYKNIPQEEGITTVCKAQEAFHSNNPPIPSHYLKEILKLIQENSFQFVGNNYIQTHGTAMGTKMAVAFGNTWPILKQK